MCIQIDQLDGKNMKALQNTHSTRKKFSYCYVDINITHTPCRTASHMRYACDLLSDFIQFHTL